MHLRFHQPYKETAIIELPDFRYGMDLQYTTAQGRITPLSKQQLSISGEDYLIDPKISINNDAYTIYPAFVLASGGFGSIIIAQNDKSGQLVALKIMHSEDNAKLASGLLVDHGIALTKEVIPLNLEKNVIEQIEKNESHANQIPENKLEKEEDTIKQTAPNTVTKYMIPMHLIPAVSIWDFENGNQIFAEAFSTFNNISPLVRIQLAINIVERALAFLKTGFLHRDLQAGNILINPIEISAHLIDFDFKQQMDEKGEYGSQSYKGSILYAPLEMRKTLQSNVTSGGETSVSTNNISDKFSEDDQEYFVYSAKTEAYAIGIDLAKLFMVFSSEGEIPHPVKSENGQVLVTQDQALVQMGNDTFVIDDPNHCFCIYNEEGKLVNKFKNDIFPDQDLLVDYIGIVKKLVSERPDDRDLHEALSSLEQLKKKYLERYSEEGCDKVCLLDMSELTVDSFETDTDKFLQYYQKQGITHIIIVDTNVNRPIKDYIAMRQYLDLLGLSTNARVFRDSDQTKLTDSVKQYLDQRTLDGHTPLPYRLSAFGNKLENRTIRGLF